MTSELVVLWSLVFLQGVTSTLVVRELRRTGHSHPGRSAGARTTRGDQVTGKPFHASVLDAILPPAQKGRVHGYLFVLRTCPLCEAVLSEMGPDWRADRDWGLTLVGIGGTRSQIEAKFWDKARELGAGLAACRRPQDLGVVTAPWIVVPNDHHRIIFDNGAGALGLLRANLARAEQSLLESSLASSR